MRFNKYVANTKSLNIIIYGPPKARKTTWAGMAAESGFTTIFIDIEDGAIVLNQLSEDAKSRLWVIPCSDTASSFSGVEFMGCLFKRDKFIWSVKRKRQIISTSGVIDDDHYLLVQKSALNNNIVLVLDSWTALVASLRGKIFSDMGMAIDEAKKLEWSDYGSGNQVLTNFLNAWRGLQCHKIIIGHEEFREKSIKIGTVETKRTRGQIISFSGNHSATLPAFFDEVVYFYGKEGGFGKPAAHYLSTAFNTDRDGGGRVIPSAEYEFSTYPINRLIDDAGVAHPNPALPFEFITEMNAEEVRAHFGGNKTATTTGAPALVSPAFQPFSIGKK